MRLVDRKIILRLMPLAIATAAAIAGYKVQGWPGLFLWPVALCAAGVLLLIGWFIIDLFVAMVRHTDKVSNLQAPLRRLSDEELQERAADASRIDSGFALVELMSRDQDAAPSKAQLFAMLTSGNSALCGQAMVHVQVFYPELARFLAAASNQDPRSVWKARVAKMQAAATGAMTQD